MGVRWFLPPSSAVYYFTRNPEGTLSKRRRGSAEGEKIWESGDEEEREGGRGDMWHARGGPRPRTWHIPPPRPRRRPSPRWNRTGITHWNHTGITQAAAAAGTHQQQGPRTGVLPIREREEVCTSGVREGCTGVLPIREREEVSPSRRGARRRPLTLGCPRLAVASLAIAGARPRAPHTPRPALALSLLSRCAVRHRAPPFGCAR